jgi:hypothetical protein
MDYLIHPVELPLNKWNKSYISPGAVGSVGDTLTSVRLKQSSPDMNPRYEAWSTGLNSQYYGSNVQDGQKASFMSEGLNARTLKRAIMRFPEYKTSVGWRHQDIVPTDRTREAKQVALPAFGYQSLQASVLKAKTAGDKFLPLPGGYGISEMTRGSQFPVLVTRSSGSAPPVAEYVAGPSVVDQSIQGTVFKPRKGVVQQTAAFGRYMPQRLE